jgi:prephenate dehydrogenase
VESADLVVIALPLADQRDTLRALAPSLRPGGVVACLTSLLNPALAWAAEVLSGDRHFVACHPILNPAHLHRPEVGLDAARADLFAKGLWALAPAPVCAPEALRLVVDVAQIVGAAPYFVDPAEHDGLAAAVEALPALLAWALMRASTAAPGWREMRKVADQKFALATAAITEAEPAALTLNRQNVLRHLDGALAALQSLRENLAQEKDVALAEALAEVVELRARWLAERQRADWAAQEHPPTEMPTPGENLSRIFLGNLFGRRRDSKKDGA